MGTGTVGGGRTGSTLRQRVLPGVQPCSLSAPTGGDASINTCNGRELLTRPDGLVTLNCTASTAPSGCDGNARSALLVSDESKLVALTCGLNDAESSGVVEVWERGRYGRLSWRPGWLGCFSVLWGASFVQQLLLCANMAGDLAAHEDAARTVGGC